MQTAPAVTSKSLLWLEGTDILDAVRAQHRHKLQLFIKEKHAAAVGYARMFFAANLANAEEAVSRTYLQLLRGQTSEEYFFIALKRNAKTLAGELRRAFGRCGSTDFRVMTEDGEYAVREFPSRQLDDADPLDILIERENRAQERRLVRKAMKDPRWRAISRRKWALPLLETEREGRLQ